MVQSGGKIKLYSYKFQPFLLLLRCFPVLAKMGAFVCFEWVILNWFYSFAKKYNKKKRYIFLYKINSSKKQKKNN